MKLYQKIILSVCGLSLMFSSVLFRPTPAQAILGVPIDTLFNWHNIQQQLKDFVLNGLAWSIAKAMVRKVTGSVVTWINSGFEGSPAFLTNPEGYFLDIGDQITGEFISQNGPLQGLCSPWNIDLRLSIGLARTQPLERRYTCTLGSIIGNAKNATVNGYSIEGFTSGDFSQGGWPAFISMTNEPQNNPYGMYLQAKSDLEQQISEKNNAVNNDLNRGQGFLSWQKCDATVIDAKGSGGTELGLDSRDLVQLNNTGKVTTAKGAKYETSKDAKGVTTYKTCSTQTPGSVINGSLQKSLGAGIDQLNLADSINEITDALFAQLINKVLENGLGGSTRRTSGQTQSTIDQITADADFSNASYGIEATYSQYVNDAQNTESQYKQAIAAFTTAQTDFALAQGCYQDITVTDLGSKKAQAQNALDEIQAILIGTLAVDQTTYQGKLDRASGIVNAIQSQIAASRTIKSATEAARSSNDLQVFMASQISTIQEGHDAAPTDLAAAQASAAKYDVTAKQYQQRCQVLKSSN